MTPTTPPLTPAADQNNQQPCSADQIALDAANKIVGIFVEDTPDWHMKSNIQEAVSDAITASRRAVGGSMIAAVDAAMVEMANITPPLRRSECERLIRAALAAAPASLPDVAMPEQSTFSYALNPLEHMPVMGLRLAYYVKHPDGSYSLADPQPTLLKPEYRAAQPAEGIAKTCSGCDPAEGFCKACRDAEGSAQVATCSHVWNDFGQLGCRNVSWCPRCDTLAWTGKEPEPSATPAAVVQAPGHRDTPADVLDLIDAAEGMLKKCADQPSAQWHDLDQAVTRIKARMEGEQFARGSGMEDVARAAQAELLAEIVALLVCIGLNRPQAESAADKLVWLFRRTPAAEGATQAGELYECIGKGGRYELLGVSKGAGALRNGWASELTLYRDTATGQLYHRDALCFGKRMARIDGDKQGGA